MKTNNTILHQFFSSQELEVEDTLPVNDDILDFILRSLAKEDIGTVAQPNLIVGETGSGKTHLLKRVESNMKHPNGFRFRAIFIEGKTLFSTDDIWVHCVEQLGIENSLNPYEDVLRWQEEYSLRIVLLIDNIHYYFERTANFEHFVLRGELNKPGAPILIATSDKVLPAFTDYNAAFFEGFRISYIKPISFSEMESLIGSETDILRLKNLMGYLPHTLRSLFVSMYVMEISDNPESDFIFLTDCYAPYYQTKYDEYPAQVQKILSVLSAADEGLSLKGIRDKIRQENGKLSPYLKMMIDRKLIEKTAQTPRTGIYKISDPLFKLWLRSSGA